MPRSCAGSSAPFTRARIPAIFLRSRTRARSPPSARLAVEDRDAPPALRATSPHGGEAKLRTVTPHRPFGPPPHVVGRRIRCSKRPTGPSGHLPTWWGGEVEDRDAPPALRATSPHGGEAN